MFNDIVSRFLSEWIIIVEENAVNLFYHIAIVISAVNCCLIFFRFTCSFLLNNMASLITRRNAPLVQDAKRDERRWFVH